MPAKIVEYPAFDVIGIEARTNNAREMSGQGVIGTMWGRLMSEGILDKIPNRVGDTIYALYTGYASDRNGDYDFVTKGFNVWNDDVKVKANVDLFTQTLQSEIMPAVDREYNVAAGRDNRGIIGLSMGGLESLSIGLNHNDQFAWVGGMSSAVFSEHFDTYLPNAGSEAFKKNPMRLLWVACGTGDRLYAPNQHFLTWGKARGLDITPVFTPGAHTWLVWRDNLIHFAPLLFRK